ncbi:MAG: FtsX-like permease family protein [Eubacterium ramulus]
MVSCNSVQAMRDEFSKSFGLINCVVVLVTALAAGLAFVVLFTLATTNISERERERATIKVLGFFDKEVHSYVKGTLILTVIGILLGLPVGRFSADF